MSFDLLTIPCLSDNYAYLLHDRKTGETACIDVPEARPIKNALAEHGWTLSQGFRYEKLDWDYRSTYAIAVTGEDRFSRGSSRQSEDSETISLDTRLAGEVTTGHVPPGEG